MTYFIKNVIKYVVLAFSRSYCCCLEFLKMPFSQKRHIQKAAKCRRQKEKANQLETSCSSINSSDLEGMFFCFINIMHELLV